MFYNLNFDILDEISCRCRRKTNSQKLFREEEANLGQRADLRDPNVASAGPGGQLIALRGHAAGQGAQERGRGHGGTDKTRILISLGDMSI